MLLCIGCKTAEFRFCLGSLNFELLVRCSIWMVLQWFFTKVSKDPVPLKYSKTGHLMTDISNWSRSKRRKETIVDTKHIEVFPVVTAETTMSEKRVLRTKERKKVQKMADESKAHGRAI